MTGPASVVGMWGCFCAVPTLLSENVLLDASAHYCWFSNRLSLASDAPFLLRLILSYTKAILLRFADGFMTPLLPSHGRAHLQPATRATSCTTMQAGGSYADKLRQAQEAKQAASGGQSAAADGASGGGGGGGMPMPSDSESPFPADTLEEIRTAIKILAARLQREKPMSRAEFERFEAAVAIIVEDALPAQELPTQQQVLSPAAAAVTAPPVVSSPESAAAAAAAAAAEKETDMYESEGPAWDPAQGGYGLPAGVENSYVLEGMAEMDPEEYQEALRKKVVSRAQTARRSGAYG